MAKGSNEKPTGEKKRWRKKSPMRNQNLSLLLHIDTEFKCILCTWYDKLKHHECKIWSHVDEQTQNPDGRRLSQHVGTSWGSVGPGSEGKLTTETKGTHKPREEMHTAKKIQKTKHPKSLS